MAPKWISAESRSFSSARGGDAMEVRARRLHVRLDQVAVV